MNIQTSQVAVDVDESFPKKNFLFDLFRNGRKKRKPTESVRFYSLFRYAKPIDLLFMLIGTIAALSYGATLPLLILIFGNVIDSFTDQGSRLCSFNLTTLSKQYCPPGVELTSINLFSQISICNITKVNFINSTFNIETEINQQSIYLITVGFCAIVVGYLQVAFWSMPAKRQARTIQQILFRAIIHKEIEYFDIHKTGELTIHLTDTINKFQNGIGDKLGCALQFISSFSTGFAIGFVKGWKLTLVILSMSPLLFIATTLFSVIASHMTAIELKAYGKAGAIAEEVLSSIRTVFAYNAQEREAQRYEKRLHEAMISGIKKGMTNGVTMGFICMLLYFTYALGFWYGGKLIIEGEYTIGKVCTIFFAIRVGIFSFSQAGVNLQALTEAKAAAYIIWQVIDTPSKIVSDSIAGIKSDKLIGEIHFSNVNFSYPIRPTIQILNKLSFHVKPGEIVGLVGLSGCGKSTCIQLLQRFYDVNSGSIMIDGKEINTYNLSWLRQQIAVVSQEPILFHATIRENIMLGLESATHQQIEEAAKMANAHDFIMKLPDKYETIVGERGAALSGGQKQRIAIARALIRDPRILLLDEATSAMDNQNEKIIQEALNRSAKGRTTLIVAHRLMTIRNADKIIVMDKGEIIEEGNHNSLMSARGTYYDLIKRQKRSGDKNKKQQDMKHSILTDEHRIGLERQSTILSNREDKNEKKKKKKSNVGLAMLKMNKPEWLLIVFGCLSCIINGCIELGYGIVISKLIAVFQKCDKDVENRQVDLSVYLFLSFGAVGFVAMFFQNYLFAHSGEALTQRLRSLVFRALLRQDMTFFDQSQNNTGALCSRLAIEASAVQGATGVRLGVICQYLATLGTGVIVSFIFSWQLSLLVLGFFPLIILGGFLQSYILTRFTKNYQNSIEETNQISTESIQNIRTVVQLTKEKHFYDNYCKQLNNPFRSSMIQAHVIAIIFAVTDSISYFMFASLFSLGGYLVNKSYITFEDVLIVLNCIVFASRNVSQSTSIAPDFGKAKAAAKKILDFLDEKSSIDNGSTKGAEIPNFTGQLEFDGVQFYYPNRPEVVILQDLKLKIKPHQKVAFVGASGCGKSTSIQLIERFYDPTIGCVRADNKDIRSLNLQWYRSQIGIVQQEPILFDISIRENIAYGDTNRNDIPMDEIIRVAQLANIHEFIKQLPDGYDTICGAKGTQLSGGEKQRIAIARALIRNPKILLLDEATSALDNESEKVVQEALDQAQQNRTSIIVAHRLSTIQHADMICVIDNGIIVEKGTHQQLLELRGRYSRLI